MLQTELNNKNRHTFSFKDVPINSFNNRIPTDQNLTNQ